MKSLAMKVTRKKQDKNFWKLHQTLVSPARGAREEDLKKRKKTHGAQQPIGPITLPRTWSPGAGQTLAYSPRASVWPESARCCDPSLEEVFCFVRRLGAAVFFQKAETQKSFLGGRPKVRTEKLLIFVSRPRSRFLSRWKTWENLGKLGKTWENLGKLRKT